MNPLDLTQVQDYVSHQFINYYEQRVKLLKELKIDKLLGGNPYIFPVRNIGAAGDIIMRQLDAFLSSSEEKLFGDFLEGLARYVAEMTCGGHKSSAPGVDLEFIHRGVHYLISIKSGPNWGNSSQQSKLEDDLKNAVTRVKQAKRGVNVQPVLGICYGKTRTGYLRGYLKIVGQNFWYLISENENLYTEIIEPIGYKAKEHNETFLVEKANAINRFTKQFIDRFCDEKGAIDWKKLVEFNSGNLDLHKFLP